MQCLSMFVINIGFVPLGVSLWYVCTLTHVKSWENWTPIVIFVDFGGNLARPNVDAFKAKSVESMMFFSTFTDVCVLQRTSSMIH